MLLVHAFSKTWLSKIWFMFFPPDLVVQVVVYVVFSQTWLSKFWFTFCFPRLGCPSFGSFCNFFQDLVVQVLVHLVFFPRLGCPSFGSCFFSKTWLSKFWFMFFSQDLVVQVVVYVVFSKTWLSEFWFTFCFPRLGCPSFGSCVFSKTWLSKFWFLCFFPRLGCPSFGLLYFCPIDCSSFGFCFCQYLVVQVLVCCSCKTWLFKFRFVVCPRLGFCCWFIFSRTWLRKFQQISLSLSPAPSRRFEHQAEDIFFGFQVLVDVSSTVFEFNGVCSKMLICINLQAVVLHLLLHRRRQRLGGVS